MQHLLLSILLAASLLYNCSNGEQPSAESAPAPISATPAPTEAKAVAAVETTMEEPASPEEAAQLVAAPAGPAAAPKTTRQPAASTAQPKEEKPASKAEAPKEQPVAPKAEPFPDEENPRTVAPPAPTKVAPTPSKQAPATKPNFALSHDQFDALLRRHVSSSGKVNYSGFKKDKPELEAYLSLLKKNPPKSDWSKNKEMAYWINLYNAFTIKTILDAYPVKSIMDIDGGKVWDKRTTTVGGKAYTLNDIEKKQLLKRFREPRVHFAVNCAAASCPPLLNKAWTEDNIQRCYSKQAKAFINNATHNTLGASKVELSQIFNWYADDFGGKDKVVAYIKKYAETEVKSSAKVSFKTYNWSLND